MYDEGRGVVRVGCVVRKGCVVREGYITSTMGYRTSTGRVFCETVGRVRRGRRVRRVRRVTCVPEPGPRNDHFKEFLYGDSGVAALEIHPFHIDSTEILVPVHNPTKG